MKTSHKRLEQLAESFCTAFYTKRWPGSGQPNLTGLSLEDSYRVQDAVAAIRLGKGEQIVGYKIGCTSAAIRQQFGLAEPIHGKLFAPHTRESDTATVDWRDFANCAIEPEMVLKTRHDLVGEDLTDQRLIDGIECVSPGVELHHFRFWGNPPTTQELICSGGIHAGLIIGSSRVAPQRLDFQQELFSVYKDGQRVTTGAACEIMGGPLHSLRWLVKSLTQSGTVLPKGSLVIPGSPVQLIEIDADTQLKVDIDRVGSLTVAFSRRAQSENAFHNDS